VAEGSSDTIRTRPTLAQRPRSAMSDGR